MNYLKPPQSKRKHNAHIYHLDSTIDNTIIMWVYSCNFLDSPSENVSFSYIHKNWKVLL